MLKLHNDALRFEGQLGQRLWSDGQVAYVKNRLGIGDDAPSGDAGDCSPASDASGVGIDPIQSLSSLGWLIRPTKPTGIGPRVLVLFGS